MAVKSRRSSERQSDGDTATMTPDYDEQESDQPDQKDNQANNHKENDVGLTVGHESDQKQAQGKNTDTMISQYLNKEGVQDPYLAADHAGMTMSNIDTTETFDKMQAGKLLTTDHHAKWKIGNLEIGTSDMERSTREVASAFKEHISTVGYPSQQHLEYAAKQVVTQMMHHETNKYEEDTSQRRLRCQDNQREPQDRMGSHARRRTLRARPLPRPDSQVFGQGRRPQRQIRRAQVRQRYQQGHGPSCNIHDRQRHHHTRRRTRRRQAQRRVSPRAERKG